MDIDESIEEHKEDSLKQTPTPLNLGGMHGWVCPVCGRGNSPFSSNCPCVPMPPMKITCL
jgi:hypothetical protein